LEHANFIGQKVRVIVKIEKKYGVLTFKLEKMREEMLFYGVFRTFTNPLVSFTTGALTFLLSL